MSKLARTDTVTHKDQLTGSKASVGALRVFGYNVCNAIRLAASESARHAAASHFVEFHRLSLFVHHA